MSERSSECPTVFHPTETQSRRFDEKHPTAARLIDENSPRLRSYPNKHLPRRDEIIGSPAIKATRPTSKPPSRTHVGDAGGSEGIGTPVAPAT